MPTPIEVFEAVIDRAGDDTQSLRHISLTCSAFLPRARYHLFSSIRIRTVEQMECSRNFFDSRPWLHSLVQTITLKISVPLDSSRPNLRLLDIVPVHLLTQFPNLQGWTLGLVEFDIAHLAKLPYLSFHRSALRCYQRCGGCIRNLELSHIPFNNISDFRRLVSAFTRIYTFTCSMIWFKRYPSRPDSRSNLVAQAPKIEDLRVSFLIPC